MANIDRATILGEHCITMATVLALSAPDSRNKYGLDIWKDLNALLSDDEFNIILSGNIFFNAFFSPASNSIIKTNIPIKSKIITIDINALSLIQPDERIVIILHELGHAFFPTDDIEKGEFLADDFVIKKGYGNHLKKSLLKNIENFPDEYNKPITHKRINRISQPD